MEFRLNAEQELFKQSVREFCEKTIAPRAREIDEQGAGIPDDIVRSMADLGLFGLTIPEAYGGFSSPGEESVYAMLAVSEIARADLGMSVPVYTLLCMGWSRLVAVHGSEQLKQEILPKIASGDLFLGICVTEPGGGSDVANIKTSAKRVGDTYVINGEKLYISGIAEARQRGGGHITLFRTAPELGIRGMTFAYVPTASPGISATFIPDMGRMGLSTGGMVYKDVVIPSYYTLGQENRGFHLNMEGFNIARILVAAACVGAAEKALELSAQYTQQRKLFGLPLIKNQGISFEIAEDRAKLVMLKNTLLQAAWMVDQHYKDGSFTTRELNEIVAICKLTAPALSLDIVRHAMIHHGAYGYTKECPLEMAMRGLMSYNVGAEGGANIMKLIIAREFVGDIAIPYR